MRNRSPLPDFGIYFHADSPISIDFTCRNPPNLFHDLVFLDSYIHDARFKIKDVHLQRRKLQIPLLRDRWERYQSLGELECVPCLLTVSPALSIDWKFNGKTVPRGSLPKAEEFAIRYVYLGESYWDDSDCGEIVLRGHGRFPSELRITVRDPFLIRIKDRNQRKINTR